MRFLFLNAVFKTLTLLLRFHEIYCNFCEVMLFDTHLFIPSYISTLYVYYSEMLIKKLSQLKK